jgi:hypothetical protein
MKSPKPPDPYATAGAQQNAEVGAAGASSIMNNPNTYTPYGSQTYSIAGWEQVPDAQGRMMSVPRYNMQQQLSPDQQRLQGLQTGTQYNMGQTALRQSAGLRDQLGKPMDTSSWAAWNQGPKAGEIRQDQGPTDRKAIEDAMMASYSRQADPRNQAEQAQRAARGMNVGSEQDYRAGQQQADAFGEATRQAYLGSGQESRSAQDAYNQAALQRFTMGGQEADRTNALRGMQAQEGFALRNQPLNELNALLGGSAVTMPQFNAYQGQGISAPNIMGAVQNQYTQQANNANAFNSGLFGLGSNLLGGWAGGGFGK